MDFLWDVWTAAEAIFLPELATYETEIFAVTAVVGLLVLLVLLKCCFSRGQRGRCVCLLGLSDAGKTLLYMRLIYGHYSRTQNSITENKASYEPAVPGGKKRSVELVDIPGDERIRDQVLSKYRNLLRAVVLVIDSVKFPQEVRNVAELTFDLLLDGAVRKGRVPLLVACNKQDLASARGCEAIRKQLEREITALRVSRSAKLEATEGPKGRQTKTVFLGKEGKDFEFSDLPCKLEFVGCSARGKGEEGSSVPDIEKLKNWIDEHC